MSDERRDPFNEDDEDELAELRFWAIRIFLGLSAFVTILDPLARLFRDPTFRVDAVVYGLIYGTTLALLGIEGWSRFLGGGKNG